MPLHIVMFPWLAFGHVLPYLNLSKLLAQKGHRITFISTPRNIDRLPKLPPHLTSSISFVKIPLPKVNGLPENAQATMDIPPHQMDLLKKAFDGLQPGLTHFLEGSDPDWIIYDFAPLWLPPIAARLGVSTAFFFIINAWFLSIAGPVDTLISGSDYRTRPEDFMVPPKWVKFDTKVAFRRFEAEWIFGSSQNDGSGFTDFRRIGGVIDGCDAILIRHCYEFEPNWLGVLEEIHHKKVVPLGLMPPTVDTDSSSDTWTEIKDWLDSHVAASVVYVAFGSEVTLSPDQLSELARGLELSHVPFFWVLKNPSGSAESDTIQLPSGFEKRVSGRGIVWRGWAPQFPILSHKSLGGFLTHCGWSSILEGLMCGHPLIALPFGCDQGLNARVLVANQLGVEIPRNDENGSYIAESIAESLRLAMVEKEGEILRESAKEKSKMFSDVELHNKYIDRLVEFMEGHTRMLKS